MGLQCSIQNGGVSPPGNGLTYGSHFEWANPTSKDVRLTGCSGFCTADEYYVPAGTLTNPGLAVAQILQNPPGPFTFAETPNEWNTGGTPRIVVNPWPAAKNKDVA
jgi:hypothetical protein